MNKKVKKGVSLFVQFMIAGGILWFVSKNVNFESSMEEMSSINLGYAFLSLLAGTISHAARASRWTLLINSAQKKKTISFLESFCAIMAGYVSNLGIPRSGEILRVALISKHKKQQFDFLLGTVALERIIDVLMLAFIFLTGMYLQYEELGSFFFSTLSKNTSINPIVPIILFFLLVIGGIIFLITLRKIPRVRRIISQFMVGIKSIKQLNRKESILFTGESIFIWVGYLMAFYFSLKCFDSLSNLGFLVAFNILILSAFSVSVPLPGSGLGLFHILITSLLITFYGVGEPLATLYAYLSHFLGNIFLVVLLGVPSILYFLLKQYFKKNNLFAQ